MMTLHRVSVFLVIALLVGCAGQISRLDHMKNLDEARDYVALCNVTVDCAAGDEGCNQQHLLKGKGCFEQAKLSGSGVSDDQLKAWYASAVEHIDAGIAATDEWDTVGPRAQWYENLCEAIRNLKDLEKGDRAQELTEKLRDTADRFESLEPGNAAAAYFHGVATFMLLRPRLLNPDDPAALCEELNAILSKLDAVPSVGERYAANYERLRADVAGAKQTVEGCQ